MRVLVTGAAGFIGSHLVEALMAAGDDVVSFVKTNSDMSFLSGAGTNDVVYGDVMDRELLERAFKGVDAVYHLAAIPNWQGGVSEELYRMVNVEGTRNALEACKRNSVKRFLFVSSLEAVGRSCDGSPLSEETDPHPSNIYGRTKLAAEEIVREYCANGALETVCVRLPLVYGPRNMLHLKRYFRMVKRGYYPIVNDGTALMEFCYIRNVTYGLRLAMASGNPGSVYFLSDERSYEFREVVMAIAAEQGVSLKLIKMSAMLARGVGLSFELLSKVFRFYPFYFKEMGRPAFSRQSVDWMAKSMLFCDISRARRELGYDPPYSLQEGIKETVKWYKQIGVL